MERQAKVGNAPFHAYQLYGGAGHFNVVRPITKLLAAKLLADAGPACSVTFTPQELADAFNSEFHPKLPVTCRTLARVFLNSASLVLLTRK